MKTSMLNPCRIYEIYMDFVDAYLFTKYLHGFHVNTFHVDNIDDVESISTFRLGEILRFIEEARSLNTRRHTIWQNLKLLIKEKKSIKALRSFYSVNGEYIAEIK